MSTGKRLAKRSIIGTRVCALGTDGLYYSGVIQNVKSLNNSSPSFLKAPVPSSCASGDSSTSSSNLYIVRFDMKRNAGGVIVHPGVPQQREFRDVDLIGPGFGNIFDCDLKKGQKIFVTHNGRECNGEVLEHDIAKDEVSIKIVPHGQESPLELKKRLEEVRLLESRRSARLADQERDTDFARLADMADRRRASHSIDVPFSFTQNGSRKRRPSSSQDDHEFMYMDDGKMDECNAALILLRLSCSPHSPPFGHWKQSFSSSPGSSSASWSSGSSSPPLSDDNNNNIIINNRNRTTSLSTSDEGIVMDYGDDLSKRAPKTITYKCTWWQQPCGKSFTTITEVESHIRMVHLGPKKPRQTSDDDGTFSDSDHEEEFYYEEVDDDEQMANNQVPASPPTLSHRDMARPPHEDPEYQRQIVGCFRQGFLANQIHQYSNSQYHHQNGIKPPLPLGNSATNSPSHPRTYSWSQQSPTSPQKHVRLSPRPSSYAPYPTSSGSGMSYSLGLAQHNINTYLGTPSSGPAPNSPPPNSTAALSFSSSFQQMSLPPMNHQFGNNNSTASPTASPSSMSSSSGSSSVSQFSPQTHSHRKTAAGSSSIHLSPKQNASLLNSPGGKSTSSQNRSPLSPNRRTRGENKKCRKIYGMDQKTQWCTQCKWKKACTRFSD